LFLSASNIPSFPRKEKAEFSVFSFFSEIIFRKRQRQEAGKQNFRRPLYSEKESAAPIGLGERAPGVPPENFIEKPFAGY